MRPPDEEGAGPRALVERPTDPVEAAAFDSFIATFPGTTVILPATQTVNGRVVPATPDAAVRWPVSVREPEDPEQLTDRRLVDGICFAMEAVGDAPGIWGDGDAVLAASGEPTLIVGPDGVGKTTLLQRFAMARVGVGHELLGLPVAEADERVLYVAADRPKQGARSLWRMVKSLEGADHARLKERLLVWRGPLAFDVVNEPERLSAWARSLGASDVILDSLGMLVPSLTKDEVGSAVAQCFSHTVADGIELVVNMHPRKANAENAKPSKLEDVYGSRWITAACGSVVSLWGNAGDPVIDLRHLKQPAAEVGPFSIEIDHDTGTVTVAQGSDLLSMLRSVPLGLSAQEAAVHMSGASEPARVKQARRKLERLVARGHAFKREGEAIHGAVRDPDRYFATPMEGQA